MEQRGLSMSDAFLIEIGTEELPPKSLRTLAQSFHDEVVAGFSHLNLAPVHSEWFATPRRLAVRINELPSRSPDTQEIVLGPPASAAKNAAGEWTPAAIGFAKKQGVSADELELIDSDKGPRLGFTKTVPGAQTELVAAHVVNEALAKLPIAKRMRWGSSRTEFVRPVHWVVCLYGDNDDLGTIFGLTASRVSRGHRFMAPEPIEIRSAATYEEDLLAAKVIVDYEKRKAMILKQVQNLAATYSAAAQIDDDLLNEVTALVEWPVALSGEFDRDFLRVPSEALIASMKEHQKYFHLQDSEGKLLPRFITVANIESPEPERIVHGNERVIRPRLADAAFFYDTDLKTLLADRRIVLEKMTFQHKLGSVYDKVARVASLASFIATKIGADASIAARGAELAKSDLASELVNEFPELQGIAGAYYARAEGLGDEIANVIEQHYLPRFATDVLPDNLEATAVAIADRCDTLAGIFAIGEIPSGSKDPFALRRASLAVLRLIIDNNLNLDLAELFSEALNRLPFDVPPNTLESLIAYLNERYYARYEAQGIPITTIRAVINQGVNEPLDFQRRLNALVAFSDMPEALVLASAYKRVSNILAKADAVKPAYIDELLVETAEHVLAKALQALKPALDKAISTKDYSGYLTHLASLRQPVDVFFNEVMVNAEDAKLRQNRLGLLATLASLFGAVADLKELVIS